MTKAVISSEQDSRFSAPERSVALSIAGFDPSSGAGITADLKVFAAHRIYGMACITALTVQSTLGVRRVEPVAVATIRETLDCLSDDVTPSGVKIGMLATEGAVAEVAEVLTFEGRGHGRKLIDRVAGPGGLNVQVEKCAVAAVVNVRNA